MTDFNFPHPLRLARGSHEPGSGKGCAMNVIAWENAPTIARPCDHCGGTGDAIEEHPQRMGDPMVGCMWCWGTGEIREVETGYRITDYPECSARPLARIVQKLNDILADEDGFLSPEDSLTVLEIGHLTVGTAGYDWRTLKLWLRDLLVDPVYGVTQHATADGAAAIRRVADLLAREGKVTRAEWLNARDAADAADAADVYAAYAAYAAAHDAAYTAYDAAYAAYAAYAAAYAFDAQDRIRVEWTRWAVQRFRDLMGLDAPKVDQETTEAAVRRMLGVSA